MAVQDQDIGNLARYGAETEPSDDACRGADATLIAVLACFALIDALMVGAWYSL